MSRLNDALTDQFLAWEILGRGTLPTMDTPVRPEPPFVAFPGYHYPKPMVVDDGRRHTAISAFVEDTQRPGSSPEPEEPDEVDYQWEISERESVIEIPALLPTDFSPKPALFESCLMSLADCTEPIAVELVGTAKETFLQFATGQSDAAFVTGQLEASFPEASFPTATNKLADAWASATDGEPAICEFSLGNEFFQPLSSGHPDVFVPLTGVLSGLHQGECALMQVLFEPTRYPWAQSAFQTLLDESGSPVFDNTGELIKEAHKKFSQPLYGVVIRIAAQTPDPDRSTEILQQMSACLSVFSGPNGNTLTPQSNEEYPLADHIEDLLQRQTRRFGMLLNLDELLGLVHLPSAEVRSHNFLRSVGRSKSAPGVAINEQALKLGTNLHRGVALTVGLTPDQRTRHMHVIGANGTGKSTLLLNCIIQDMSDGHGLAVLDPHGDLIDQALHYVPKSRLKDVILLDPSDEDFPIGFNILSAHSDQEKTLLASDLCSVFQRLATSWGDQMTAVLSNAILAFLESTRGGTLADLRRFLVEKPFRDEFLTTVNDPEVVYFWEKEYLLLKGHPEGSVVTRLNTFLRPKPIRYMVAQKDNRLDFAKIMDEGKILFVKLSQGTIGKENSSLLGALIVAKLHQLTLGRQSQKQEDRRYFWLYMDEFQNFVTNSMAELLSGARKFHLGLILAHQDLQQLEGRDRNVASAVIANPYTRVCFRLGDQDARKLDGGFSDFTASDLQSLSIGEAICRMERSDFDFNLATPLPLPYTDEAIGEDISAIVEHSRQSYATPKSQVESALAKERPNPKQAQEKEPKIQTKEPEAPAASPFIEKPDQDENAASLPGRGGPAHKALQSFIKQLAESYNYRVTIEKTVLDGQGHIDLALEREDRKIAVEISITTPVDKEIGNLRKCLDAGFDPIIMLSPDSKRLEKIQKATIDAFQVTDLEKICFCQQNEIATVLQKATTTESPTEGIIHKGYEIKASFQSMNEAETRSKQKSIQKTIGAALRKLRKK